MSKLQQRSVHYTFICDLCGLAFASQKDLDIHRSSHSPSIVLAAASNSSQPLSCPICDTKFESTGLLRRHIAGGCNPSVKLNQRSGEEKASSANDATKSHECETCGLRFAWYDNLVSHQRSHTKESFACEICFASFRSTASVKVHMWKVHSHQSKNTIAVPISSASPQSKNSKQESPSSTLTTIKSNSIKSEANTSDSHSELENQKHDSTSGSKPNADDAKPYVCEKCGKGFQYDFSYKAHVNIHSLNGELPVGTADSLFPASERPWVCNLCGGAFKLKFRLVAHERNCCRKIIVGKSKADKGPITIAQFADLVQLGVVGGSECNTLQMGDGSKDGNSGVDSINLADFAAGFSDDDVTVVPVSRMPSDLMDFFMMGDFIDDKMVEDSGGLTSEPGEISGVLSESSSFFKAGSKSNNLVKSNSSIPLTSSPSSISSTCSNNTNMLSSGSNRIVKSTSDATLNSKSVSSTIGSKNSSKSTSSSIVQSGYNDQKYQQSSSIWNIVTSSDGEKSLVSSDNDIRTSNSLSNDQASSSSVVYIFPQGEGGSESYSLGGPETGGDNSNKGIVTFRVSDLAKSNVNSDLSDDGGYQNYISCKSLKGSSVIKANQDDDNKVEGASATAGILGEHQQHKDNIKRRKSDDVDISVFDFDDDDDSRENSSNDSDASDDESSEESDNDIGIIVAPKRIKKA